MYSNNLLYIGLLTGFTCFTIGKMCTVQCAAVFMFTPVNVQCAWLMHAHMCLNRVQTRPNKMGV